MLETCISSTSELGNIVIENKNKQTTILAATAYEKILFLFSTKSIKRNRVECIVNQKYICILGFIIYAEIWILYKTLYGGRISLYCDFFLISLIPFVFNKIIKPRYCAKYVMILALFIYWVLIVFGGGLADSNIYRFRF